MPYICVGGLALVRPSKVKRQWPRVLPQRPAKKRASDQAFLGTIASPTITRRSPYGSHKSNKNFLVGYIFLHHCQPPLEALCAPEEVYGRFFLRPQGSWGSELPYEAAYEDCSHLGPEAVCVCLPPTAYPTLHQRTSSVPRALRESADGAVYRPACLRSAAGV
jgi:hypothetical protein